MKTALITLIAVVLAVAAGIAADVTGVTDDLSEALGASRQPESSGENARLREQVKSLSRQVEELQTQVDALPAARPASGSDAGVSAEAAKQIARREAEEVFRGRQAEIAKSVAAAAPASAGPAPEVKFEGGQSDLRALVDTVIGQREEAKKAEDKERKKQQRRDVLVQVREREHEAVSRFAERFATDAKLDDPQKRAVDTALASYVDRAHDIQMRVVDETLDKEAAKTEADRAQEEMKSSVQSALTAEQFTDFEKRSKALAGLARGGPKNDGPPFAPGPAAGDGGEPRGGNRADQIERARRAFGRGGRGG
ncbi:MAG: hypothetical protein HY719_05645 [Planctomycetes bacterium]|nr:hypothetical protein [Planctomycetota bacterium]